MSRLADIEKRYEEIMHSDSSVDEKNKNLAELMTLMEREFHVPLMQNEEWERNNKAVIAMYRKLSMSREM